MKNVLSFEVSAVHKKSQAKWKVFKPTNMKEQIIAEGNGKPQAHSTVVGNKVVMYEKTHWRY